MRVNGYQCDACCKVNNGEEALKNWFAVYDFRKGVASDEQHFCSTHCLHEWVEKQMPVVENVAVSNVNLMPAPTTVVHNEYWRDL